ncbi:hypothetical protein [Streptomyces sp. NPDC002785]
MRREGIDVVAGGRAEEQGLKDDALDGAPPRMGVDLDAGTGVVRRKPEP